MSGTGSLYKKLAAVTAAVGRVAKNGRNEFHKYDYVTEADLVDAVRAKLAEQGVAYLFSVDEVQVRETQNGPDGKPTKGGQITTALVTITFADGETGETVSITGAGTGQDAGDKGLYKAITGAQKYALMKTFLIPTGDDPEGDTKTDQAVAGETTPAKATAKAHGKRAGTKPADDPMEKVIPSGKFKDRKVGSLTAEEAAEILTKIPAESDFGKAVTARAETLKALVTLEAVAPGSTAAIAALDPETAKP